MMPRQQTPQNAGFNQFVGPQTPQGSMGPQIAQLSAVNGGISAQNAMFQGNGGGGGQYRPPTQTDVRAMQKAMEMQRQRERLQGMALNGGVTPMALNPELMIDSFLQANVSAGLTDMAAHPQMRFPHQQNLNPGAMGAQMRMPLEQASMAAVASVSQQLGGVPMAGQLPALFSDENKIPAVYYQALALCSMNNQLPNTALVYNLMVTSKLSRDTLGFIWSLVNRTLPGQLTRPEFFAYLALIALAQNGQTPSYQALMGLQALPIPKLQLPSMTTATLNAAQSNSTPSLSPSTSAQWSSQTTKTANYIISTAPLEPATTTMSRNKRTTSDEFGDFAGFTTAGGTVSSANAASGNGDKYAALKELNDNGPEPLAAASGDIDLLGGDLSTHVTMDKPTSKPPLYASGLLLDEPLSESATAKSLDFVKKGGDSPDVTSANNNGALKPPSSSKEPAIHSSELTSSSSDSNALDSLSGLTFDAPVMIPTTELPVYDKYAAIKQENGGCNGIGQADQAFNVWMRCLDAMQELLTAACQLFSQASSSTVCRSVMATERGGQYLQSIALAYGVAARIRFSLKTTTFQTDEKLVHLLGELEHLWHSLLGYAVGFEHLMITPTNAELAEGFLTQKSKECDQACGVCLLSVAKSYASADPSQLDYAGRCYHPQCANFWINCVESLLPSLQLSTLL
uniref:EH domain-containing protein n=1 Tax=Plectus sambesii TaxID=2011161 RepID=A0A914VLS8_9BILA